MLSDEAQELIQQKISQGLLEVPAGVSYKFSGNYENQVRAVKRLALVIPIVCSLFSYCFIFSLKQLLRLPFTSQVFLLHLLVDS